MILRRLLPACVALSLLAAPAMAQRGRAGNPFDDNAPLPPPNSTYRGDQGFSFPGDELKPSYDRKHVGTSDPRYRETVQEQRTEAEKPGGGCLRYGAAGALGGHLAGHTTMGALAGCAAGMWVRHRDKERIAAEQRGQR